MEQTCVMVKALTLFLLFTLSASLQGMGMERYSRGIRVTEEGGGCSVKDIAIVEGASGETDPSSGMKKYLVEISNACASGCTISNIHVSCGSFTSAILVNPNLFKRIADNDCLVNNGLPLPNAHSISFQYAYSSPFPLSVTSVTC